MNIECWCGMVVRKGRMHYPGNDPENGAAHPAEPAVICSRCQADCPPDCIEKDGICSDCHGWSSGPDITEYKVIVAYHCGAGIAYSHHETLASTESSAIENAVACLKVQGIKLDIGDVIHRWRMPQCYSDELPPVVVFEINRDDCGNEVR